MKQDLIIQIKVLDKVTKAEMMPARETEIFADVGIMTGVINHVGYTIQGMVDVDKSKMIGYKKDDKEIQ